MKSVMVAAMMAAALAYSSADGLGSMDSTYGGFPVVEEMERRRGFGVWYCWWLCTAACAAGTGGIGFPTPVGVACEFACNAACLASTACFDENAEVRTIDETTGGLVTTKIVDLVDKEKEVQSAEFLHDSTHLVFTTETLVSVHPMNGDWEFYEIVVKTEDSKSHALNTTDDHGWITVDSDGSDGCVVHAADVSVGDHVLVFNEDMATPVIGTVSDTRSFNLPTKYALYTDSGLVVANGLLTTVFCDHDSNDCKAGLTLKERLDLWKHEHNLDVQESNKSLEEMKAGIEAMIAEGTQRRLANRLQGATE